MRMTHDGFGRQHRLLAFTAATAIALAFIAIGALWHGYALLEKYPPDWTTFGWARTVSTALAAMLLFVGLRPHPDQTRNRPLVPFEQRVFGHGFRTTLLILLCAMTLVITIPWILNESVREGQFLSILTEIVFVIAVVILVLCARRAAREKRGAILGIKGWMVVAAMAAAALIILMEEMSWGQHWLRFSTPPGFAGNLQNETNLHNFYTYRFEFAYYSGAVFAFVVLPYAWPRHPWKWLEGVSFYVPHRMFAIVGLPVCGLVFEAWNVIPYQIWFFLGLFIAIDLAMLSPRSGPSYRLGAATMALALFVSQFVFLVHGPNMVDGYELSEVREFVISVLILIYATWLYARMAYRPAKPKRIRWE